MNFPNLLHLTHLPAGARPRPAAAAHPPSARATGILPNKATTPETLQQCQDNGPASSQRRPYGIVPTSIKAKGWRISREYITSTCINAAASDSGRGADMHADIYIYFLDLGRKTDDVAARFRCRGLPGRTGFLGK